MNKIITALIFLAFFTLGIITLTHYGINWDTINHLPRGQAYLNYFLTGSKDYSNLKEESPEFHFYWQNPESLGIDTNLPEGQVPRRSMYQSYAVPYSYFIVKDGGHPPVSDILSAVFNRILFGKLRLVNDIDSYRVYGVLLSALLVALVYFWVSSLEGKFAGFVAALSLAAYPLFWAESHFNTEKDIPEAFYWSLLLFSVWRGFREKNWKWLLFSGLAFGLALGTKFNILFSIFVVVPWLLFVIWEKGLKKIIGKDIKLYGFGIAAVAVGVLIFIGSWPYLWADPLLRIAQVIRFYKDIGMTTTINQNFAGPFGINIYPILWIIYTTPEIVLGLFAVGLGILVRRIIVKKDSTSFLFLLWFLVPVARVVWPGTSIYGGVRQIMEYIPGMAIISGIGAGWLLRIIKNKACKVVAVVIIALGYISLLLNLIKIHPFENVYFNKLSGGIQTMKKIDLPYWGFSFGSPYRQAAVWLNENMPQGANLVFTYDLIPNIPRIFLRPDINLTNSNRSGYLRKGEYAISLAYQGSNARSYYDKYLDKFIEPAWEVKVDGVSILKIWINSDQYVKDKRKEIVLGNVAVADTGRQILFDLGETRSLSRLVMTYNQSGCKELDSLRVSVSEDGKNWDNLYGLLPRDWLIPVLGKQPSAGNFIEPFVGEEARFIRLSYSPTTACIRQIGSFKIFSFTK